MLQARRRRGRGRARAQTYGRLRRSDGELSTRPPGGGGQCGALSWPNALGWCCVRLQSRSLREEKEEKPGQTSVCSYAKLAARPFCPLVRGSFLKVSSEASGISYCLRQEDAPNRCSRRFGLSQQHLFFPSSARGKLRLHTFFLVERYERIWIWFLPLLHAHCLPSLANMLQSNMETGTWKQVWPPPLSSPQRNLIPLKRSELCWKQEVPTIWTYAERWHWNEPWYENSCYPSLAPCNLFSWGNTIGILQATLSRTQWGSEQRDSLTPPRLLAQPWKPCFP